MSRASLISVKAILLKQVPFNVPHLTGRELTYLEDALARHELAGDGAHTTRCQEWLRQRLGVSEVLLTHSCTAALEMAAILACLEPGDEVIMPSYTFVSTANAVVLRAAVPVFVDIRSDTLNIDERKIEVAISGRTRAIIAVHSITPLSQILSMTRTSAGRWCRRTAGTMGTSTICCCRTKTRATQ